MPHGQVTVFGDVGDGPPVAVFDPVGGGEAESAVVAAGDDHISDTRLIAVGQRTSAAGAVIKTMLPGTAVKLGDQLTGGGDHDCVEPRRPIGNPSAERILGRGGYVADMNTAVINVEVECVGIAFSEPERCCRFTGLVKRCSSVRWRAPWLCLMSRRMPPAPIAASC